MSIIYDFISQVLSAPLGFILSLFYNLTNNYILAIVLLTVLVRLCFLPNAVSQQKSKVSKAILDEKIKRLKAKYSDNPEKLKEETNALKENGPDVKRRMGCLPTIVQFIIMIGLFGVIYTPLTNVLHIEDSSISEMKIVMSDVIKDGDSMQEISLMKEAINYREQLLSNNILTEDALNEILSFREKYNFFGIDLSETPELKEFNKLWLIPSLVFLAGMLLPLYYHIRRRIQNPTYKKFTAIEAVPFIPPMMIFLFAFMFSAGVGLYWAISNLLTFAQTILLNIIYNPAKAIMALEETTKEDPGLTAEPAQ